LPGEEEMKAIVLSYLLISWIDGSLSGFEVPIDTTCGDLMDEAIALANEHDMGYTMMQCIYTDQIIVSPLPPPRPKDLS
jgi:hypothetical protein